MNKFERLESPVSQFGRSRLRWFKEHSHAGVEVSWVEAGRLRWWVGEDRMVVPADHLFVVAPGVLHGSRAGDEPEFNLVSWVLLRGEARDGRIRFDPDLGLAPELEEGTNALLSETGAIVLPASADVGWILRRMLANCRTEGPVARALDRSYAQLLLSKIISQGDEVAPADKDLGLRTLRAALADIRARCDEPWTLDSMAALAHLKRSRFAEKCLHMTGNRPMDYLYRCRVEMAMEALRNTERSVTEIAYACGFSSSQHFATRFRKVAWMTPSQYRASERLSAGS